MNLTSNPNKLKKVTVSYLTPTDKVAEYEKLSDVEPHRVETIVQEVWEKGLIIVQNESILYIPPHRILQAKAVDEENQ